eukprot:6187787-Pleurochrysis_carterae.AAC.3
MAADISQTQSKYPALAIFQVAQLSRPLSHELQLQGIMHGQFSVPQPQIVSTSGRSAMVDMSASILALCRPVEA